MTTPNPASSHQNVVATQTLVLAEIMDAVKREIPEAKLVYDEQLGYETALAALRRNNVEDDSPSGTYPMFAFRRSVLRHFAEAATGRRAISQRVMNNTANAGAPGSVNIYRLLHGEFDLEFIYVTKSIDDLERFEIAYLAEEGFSGTRTVTVNLEEELGQGNLFPYYVTPEDLIDKSLELEGNYYKMVQGSMKVRGWYPILKGQASRILSIHSRIHVFNTNVNNSYLVGHREITPAGTVRHPVPNT